MDKYLLGRFKSTWNNVYKCNNKFKTVLDNTKIEAGILVKSLSLLLWFQQ